MMKLVILAGLVAATLADVSHLFNRPQSPYYNRDYNRPQYNRPSVPLSTVQPAYRSGPQFAILRLDNEIYPDGRYQYAYDTENGISAQETGQQTAVGDTGATVAQGSYQYTSPEGVPVQVQYTADENGYHPVGNVLPTSPPIPEAIQRSIQFNANEQQISQQPYRRY